jgi:hypothetical protein
MERTRNSAAGFGSCSSLKKPVSDAVPDCANSQLIASIALMKHLNDLPHALAFSLATVEPTQKRDQVFLNLDGCV